MQEREIEIINKLGLHARAAAKLVNTASQYESRVEVDFAGQKADAKSIMAVMMLAASQGSTLTIRCDGRDEDDAIAAITALIDDYFGEGE